MIVISKKRLVLIVCMICVSLTAFSLKNSIMNNEAIPTVNLPVSNKVIVLDAGHGVPDERKNLLTPTE